MARILVVDDEAIARRLMCKTLVKEGFEVEQAANGQEAWEALQVSQPDALITDIDMPRMTGEELCKNITEHMTDRRFPIVVVTSKTALEHREWAGSMTNVSFIEKPLSLRKLLEKLNALFQSDAAGGHR